MNRKNRFTAFTLTSLLCIIMNNQAPAQSSYKLVKEQLGDSKITIALPEKWNQHLLVLAHGYVPVGLPLSSDFPLPLYQQLLEKGWMVAGTSYRRNGFMAEEGVEDIYSLHKYLINKYGQPDRTILQGKSMGGMISTLIAESDKGKFDGVVAIGAGLQLKDSLGFELTYKPQLPIIFLTNQSEAAVPKAYVEKASQNNDKAVFWLVKRDGHVNVNSREQEAAINSLIEFIDGKGIERNKDGTIFVKPVSTAIFEQGGALTAIKWIDPLYGNLYVELTAEDLTKLGIGFKEKFQIEYKGKSYSTLYGSTYNDVAVGEWVGFLTGDGTMQISCNYKNAGAKLNCQPGEKILITK